VEEDKNTTGDTTGDTVNLTIPLDLDMQAMLKAACEFFRKVPVEVIDMALVQLTVSIKAIDEREQALKRMRQSRRITHAMMGLTH
jgi:hypothetical protein